jgi:hypothetical protein
MGKWLAGKSIALSVSQPDDIASLGMGPEHLQDALAEISRQLLALGAQLVYGGDLREGGFTRLLFELVARYSGPLVLRAEQRPAVVDILPFPVHASLAYSELIAWESEFAEIGELRYLGPNAEIWDLRTRQVTGGALSPDWPGALSTMRKYATDVSDARIIIGGQMSEYLGRMPGILEEAVSSDRSGKPLFAIGGFGGLARIVAQGVVSGDPVRIPDTGELYRFKSSTGLEPEEVNRLSCSPHIDEIALLVMRGLRHLFARDTP